jgi:hypothetical protein
MLHIPNNRHFWKNKTQIAQSGLQLNGATLNNLTTQCQIYMTMISEYWAAKDKEVVAANFQCYPGVCLEGLRKDEKPQAG